MYASISDSSPAPARLTTYDAFSPARITVTVPLSFKVSSAISRVFFNALSKRVSSELSQEASMLAEASTIIIFSFCPTLVSATTAGFDKIKAAAMQIST